jgi:hypothetical protein
VFDVSFALDLKKKSESANLALLKKKQAEQQKAEALERKRHEQKLRAAEEKRRLEIDQRILKELVSASLLAAWNGEHIFLYQPRTPQEVTVAKCYLGYKALTPSLSKLQDAISKLDIQIKVFQNRIDRLKQQYSKNAPVLPFVIDDCISIYSVNRYIFNDRWRKEFKDKTLVYEKAVIDLSTDQEKNRVKKLKSLKLQIQEDSDLHQIKNLANELRPLIHQFQRRYSELMSSPRFIPLVTQDQKMFDYLDFSDLITRREYQLRVARYVLNELNVWSHVSSPDAIGKHMAAFRIAAGEDLFDSIFEHVTDHDLVDKFTTYQQFLEKPQSQQQAAILRFEDEKLSAILNSLYASASKVQDILLGMDSSLLQLANGQVLRAPSLKVEELKPIKNFLSYNKLVDDVKWLYSNSGRRFRKAFTGYLQSVAEQGKYMAKLKIFEVDGVLLFETAEAKELKCPMNWEQFETLLGLLGLVIADATSSGLVKLKWE